MQRSFNSLTAALRSGLCALLLLGVAASIQADDKKPDATGTWTWTSPGRNGNPERKNTLKLKVEGETVTGTIFTKSGENPPSAETPITEAKIAGDEISFTLNREFNGKKFTVKYKGTLGADSIKGKVQFGTGDDSRSANWEAKRQTEKSDK